MPRNVFPRLLRCALAALAREDCQVLVSEMLLRGSLRRSEALSIASEEALKLLERANLVEMRVDPEGEGVVYRLTPLAIELIEALMRILEPRRLLEEGGGG